MKEKKKMESFDRCCSNSSSSSVVVFLFLFLFSAASASTYISDDICGSRASTCRKARNLLQASKACPVSFEFLNYTILTSQCQGPQYPPELCCPAFKELACPYVAELNDLTTDCSKTLFSYINLHGNYTPGLFATLCRDGKEGLDCPALTPTQSVNARGSQIICNPSQLLMLTAAFLLLLLC